MQRAAPAIVVLLAGCAAPGQMMAPAPVPPAPADWSSMRVGDRVDLSFRKEERHLRLSVEVVKLDAELAWLRLGVREADGGLIEHPALRQDLVVPMIPGPPKPLPPPAPLVGREALTLSGRAVECEVRFVNHGMVDGPVVRTWRPIQPIDGLYLVGGALRIRDSSGGETTEVEVVAVRRGEATSGGAVPEETVAWFQPGQWYVTDRTEGPGERLVHHHQLEGRGGRIVDHGSQAPVEPLAGEPGPGVATFEVAGRRYALPPRVTGGGDTAARGPFDPAPHRWSILALLAELAGPALHPHLEGFLAYQREGIVVEGRY